MKITFVDGTAGFTPRRLGSAPTGGIITSLTLIPKHLASYGHEVYIVSAHETEETIDGVHYTRDRNKWSDPDIVVFNRNTINRVSVNAFKKSKIVWWLHDVVQLSYLDDDGYKCADAVVALSQYCKDTYADFYSIPDDRFVVIGNGVDETVFYPGPYKQRNPNLYVCASAPIKGLQPIDYLYYNMKRHNPDFELRLYCSQSLHDKQDDNEMIRVLNRLVDKGVRRPGPIKQPELADVFREAWCLLMPNHYPEICSNLLLQAKACGLPVVATNIGSASEFIQHEVDGLLTKAIPSDMDFWWYDFTRQAVRLYFEVDLHKFISDCGHLNVSTWKEVASQWNEMLEDVHVSRSIA